SHLDPPYQSYVLSLRSGRHRDLHSFPTRRSSDLVWSGVEEVAGVPTAIAPKRVSRAVKGVGSRSDSHIHDGAGPPAKLRFRIFRSEEHTSELQSLRHLVCRLLLEKKNNLHKHFTT